MDALISDIRHALRGYRRAPAFSTVAVLTLALGIGGVTILFSVVDGILLRPLPYPDPARIVRVSRTRSRITSRVGTTASPSGCRRLTSS